MTNFTYDALDRPLTRTYPSATADNVTFGYDSTAGGNFGIGQLTSLTDSAGTASFVYDAYGNRVSEKRTIAGIAYTTGYAYDLAGNLARVTYPSGLIVNYSRDSLGQVAQVSVQSGSSGTPQVVASGIAYLPFGPAKNLTLGNGVQITNSFDLDYRLTGTQASGAATVQSLALTYDPASNVETVSDAVTPSLSQAFQYNLGGHVTRGTGVYGTDNYTYDAMGNRLTRSVVKGTTTTSTTYTYTAANTRLLSAATGSTTLTYTYDANGAVTARKLGNTTQAAYTYNADGRLATAAGTTMKYNAFGQRSVQTVTGGGTHFLFGADEKLLAEHNAQGAVVRNYIYLNGRPLAVVDAAGAIAYILGDHLGQPQKMLNAAGAVSWHRVAGVYGDTVSQPAGTTAANPLRFPGQQQDASGLHYNYFRDYDPATGRYLEADPVGLNAGINLYAYADANPVNIVDPTGEFGLPGAIIGGAADLAYQKLVEGRSWACVSWGQVGGSAALGAVTGGAGRAAQLGRNWSRANRSMTTPNALSRYRRAMNVPPTHDVHHWLIPNRSGLPNAIKNHPLNFNPIPRQLHRDIHNNMGPARGLVAGAPGYARGAAGAAGAGAAADAAAPDCGC
ncbi:MAG TPA: RHS repeat-associated core domain-containing protein [Allosphingosinicella sp.]